jgi:hypothetical protein
MLKATLAVVDEQRAVMEATLDQVLQRLGVERIALLVRSSGG